MVRATPKLLAVIACALLVSAAAPARADDPARLPRARILEDLRTLPREPRDGDEADRARWGRVAALATAFLERFPADAETLAVRHSRGVARLHLRDAAGAIEDFSLVVDREPDSPRGLTNRYLRGLARAEAFDDATARADLLAVRDHPEAPAPLRDRCDYAVAALDTRNGDAREAVARLRELVERLEQDVPLSRKADRDLRDLVRIGGPAPALAALEAVTASIVVAVLHRAPPDGEPASALTEARDAIEAAAPSDPEVTVVSLPVDGFDAPAVVAFHAPALPRVYVLERVDGKYRVRGAGLRRAGIERRVRELREQ